MRTVLQSEGPVSAKPGIEKGEGAEQDMDWTVWHRWT